MAEEAKAQEEKKQGTGALKVIFKYLLGVLLCLVGVLLIIRWWAALLLVIRGCLGLFFILVGLITLAIAKD